MMKMEHRRSRFAAALAALVLSLGLGMAPAHAALIFYPDRASFDLANPGLPVEGFEDARIGTTPSTVIGAPLNNLTNNAVFLPDDILPGISFADNPGPSTNGLFVAGPGRATNPTIALGANNSSEALDIAFNPIVGAVGFDIFQNFGRGTQSGTPQLYPVSVFGTGDVLLGSFTPIVPSGSPGFFGVSSTNGDEIARVSINNTSAFDQIDNVAFGSVVLAPEPSTWAMMIIGLVALAIATRRKKQPAYSRA